MALSAPSTSITRAALPITTTTAKNFASLCFNSSIPLLSRFSNRYPPISLKTINTNTTTGPRIRRKQISCSASQSVATTTTESFRGTCYVVGDNIDTDVIIPPEYLTLVSSKPDEYEKLGSYALCGLPASYSSPFVEPGETKTKFSIIIGGSNFGCGSSGEHASVALGASGVKALIAESYARIFVKNPVLRGGLCMFESEGTIFDEFVTGNSVTVEKGAKGIKLINHTTGKVYVLKPIGDAGPVVDASGTFAGARKSKILRKEKDDLSVDTNLILDVVVPKGIVRGGFMFKLKKTSQN